MRYALAVLIAISAMVGQVHAAAETEEKAEKVQLFNGENLDGWKLFIPDPNVDPTTVWDVRDGVVHCKGTPAGYMRTTKQYADYVLTFKWRWAGSEGGNSGALIHIQGQDQVWPECIEVQLASRNAGDFWVIGEADFKEHVNKDDRRVPKKREHNEKPIGEWNRMKIACNGNTITVWINGLLQNEATETTVAKGFIGLQSEGAPIEFRDIVLTRTKPEESMPAKKSD
jgi:hypothetical protein